MAFKPYLKINKNGDMKEFPLDASTLEGRPASEYLNLIDVEEFPTLTYKGTPVPQTGYIENIHFNTEMSTTKVVEKLKKLPFYTDSSGITYYPIFDNSEIFIGVYFISDNYFIFDWRGALADKPASEYAIFTPVSVYSDGTDFGFVGWNPNLNLNPLNVASNWLNDFDWTNFTYSADLISDLVSITPFEKEGEINEHSIYRLSKTAKPVSVPSGELVEKVYFNTNLNVDEVVSLIDGLTKTDELVNAWLLFATYKEDGTTLTAPYLTLGFSSNGDGNGNPYCAIICDNGNDVVGTLFQNMQLDTKAPLGWNTKLIGEYVLMNAVSNSEFTESDKLINLVSTTSFENEYKGLYHYKFGEWKKIPTQVIKDVEKLPSFGSPIPNSGTLSEFYVNWDATVEEVNEAFSMKNLDYTAIPDGTFMFGIAAGTDLSLMLAVMCLSEGQFLIMGSMSGNMLPLYASSDELAIEFGMSSAGWTKELLEIEVPGFIDGNKIILPYSVELLPEFTDDGLTLSFGLENDKISHIFSAENTFGKNSGDSDANILYRTKAQEEVITGNVLELYEHINEFYINKSLTIEEVVKILDNINIKMTNDFGRYYVLSNATSETPTCYLVITKYINNGNHYVISLFNNNVETPLFYYNFADSAKNGWQVDYDHVQLSEVLIDGHASVKDDFGTWDGYIYNNKLAAIFSQDGNFIIEQEEIESGIWASVDSRFKKLISKEDIIKDVSVEPRNFNEEQIFRSYKTKFKDGTPIPTEGNISSLYINDKLTVDEVIEIVSHIEPTTVSDYEVSYTVFEALNGSAKRNLIIHFDKNDRKKFTFEYTHGNSGVVFFTSYDQGTHLFGEKYGWFILIGIFFMNISFGPLYVGTTSVTTMGNQNDKLSKIFSITNFKSEIVDTTISHYKDGKKFELQNKVDFTNVLGQVTVEAGDGIVVPNTGYVNNVYFNTGLTNEEIKQMLSQLTYFEDNNGNLRNMLLRSESSKASTTVSSLKLNDNFVLLYSFSKTSDEGIETSGSSYIYISDDLDIGFVGWSADFNGIIEVNDFVVNNFIDNELSIDIGLQNELIKELFSTMPFSSKDETYLYQLNENGTLNKEKPISVGLTKQDVIDIINNEYENAEEGAY